MLVCVFPLSKTMINFNNRGPAVSQRDVYGNIYISTIFNESSSNPIQEDINFRVEKPEINFTGRTDELGILEQLSTSADAQIFVVSGMGGVGKTQLARKFIEDCRTNYGNVIWIDSETEEHIKNAFKQLSEDELNIRTTNSNGNEKDAKSIVEQVLNKVCQRKTLFIYDNVDLINSMDFVLAVAPPVGKKPHVMITSRLQKWPTGIKVIKLRVWTLKESVEYIAKMLVDPHTDTEDDQQLLAETLHYFPLALRQATAFIKTQRESGSCKISKYIDRFRYDKCEMLNSTIFRDDSTSRYNSTTYMTWSITTRTIEGDQLNGELAMRILKIISYFDPDDIERDWFYSLSFARNPPADSEETVKSAVGLLIKYCMVDSQFQQSLISIHRLVQEVTKLKLHESQEESSVLRDALQLTSNLNDRPAFRLFPFISHFIPVFLCALSLPDLVEEFASQSVETLDELEEFAEYQQIRKFGDAILDPLTKSLGQNNRVVTKIQFFVAQTYMGTRSLEMNLEIFEKQNTNFGKEDPDTLQTQCRVAHLYHQLGREDVALRWFNDYLEIQKNLLGKENPDIFRSMLETAEKYKHGSVLQLYQIIVEKQKFCLGDSHPDTFKTMCKIANAYKSLENIDLASHWCNEAINNCRTFLLGEDDPRHLINQAKSLKTILELAELSRDLNKRADALELCQVLFQIKRFVLGDDHPDTLDANKKVASLYSELGEHLEALRLYEEIHEMCNDKWGNKHAETLKIKSNIADEHSKLGQYPEALKLYQEIFNVQMNKLGDDDYYTMQTLENIAEQYSFMGQHTHALRLNQRIYDQREGKLGDEHYLTLEAKCNIAFEQDKLGRHSEALQLYHEVYEKRSHMWSDDDHRTLEAKRCAAVQHSKLGRHTDSLRLYQEIFEKQINCGGDGYDTLRTKTNIAEQHSLMGQHSVALQLNVEIYEKRKEKLGDEHYLTLDAKCNIALEHGKLGQHADSIRLYQAIFETRQKLCGSDDYDTLDAKSCLAKQYSLMGQHTHALRLHQEIHEKRRIRLGIDNHLTLTARCDEAYEHDKLGQHVESLQLYQEVYEKRRDIRGDVDSATLAVKSDIAAQCSLLGRNSEALGLYQEIYECQREKLGDTDYETLQTKSKIEVLNKKSRTSWIPNIFTKLFGTGEN